MCDNPARSSTNNLQPPISTRIFPLTSCDDNLQLHYSNDLQALDPPRHVTLHDGFQALDPSQHNALHDDHQGHDPPRHSALHDDLQGQDPTRHNALYDDLQGQDPTRHNALHDDLQGQDPPRHNALYDDLQGQDPTRHNALHDDLQGQDPPRHNALHDELQGQDPPRHNALHDDLQGQDPPRHNALHDELQGQVPPRHNALHDDLQGQDPPRHNALHDELQGQDPPRHNALHDDLHGPRSRDAQLVTVDDLPATCVFSDSLLCLTELPHLDQLVALQPLQCFLATAAQIETSPQTHPSPSALPKSQLDATVPANMTYGTQSHQMVVVTPTTTAHLTHIRDRKKKCRSVYKHVPHREKPLHLVARRNARERRRVQSVNVAFARLRRVVPCTSSRSKRVSKVKTLQGAIDYIYHLQDLLHHNNPTTTNCFALHPSGLTNTCNILQYNSENNASNTCREEEGPAGRGVAVVGDSVAGGEVRSRPASNTTHHHHHHHQHHHHHHHQQWSHHQEVSEHQHLADCVLMPCY